MAQTAESTPTSSSKSKGNSLAVAVVFAIVGYLLASQLVSVRTNTQAAAANTDRLETLQELYNQIQSEKEDLEGELTQLREDLERYRKDAADNTTAGEAMRAELEKLELAAGLVEVTGPGVTVILTDSAAVNTTGDEQNYLIHDSDLLSVINELRSAGAEAISLNGERLLATSAVRCAGPVVTVNGRQYTSPFVIFAIGDSTTLYDALTMRSGVVDILGQWGIRVQVTQSQQLTIPQYRGAVEYRFLQPAANQVEGGVG